MTTPSEAVGPPWRACLAQVQSATTAVLTLMEGVEPAELAGARLTRAEVRRLLQRVVSALAALPDDAVTPRMPELDPDTWAQLGLDLARGGQAEQDAIARAVRDLAPTTLAWCRVYLR